MMQLPVCAGHTNCGDPILEIRDWPFLKPHMLELWLNINEFFQFLFVFKGRQTYER